TGYVPLAPVLHPVGDAAARGVVAGTIVLIVAGLIFVTHWKQARHLADDGSPMTTNSRRARQAYLNTANFTAVLILIVSASLAGYKVFEAAAPGVALANDHVAPLRSLIPLLFITGLDLIIFQRHWRDQQRLRTEPESGMDGPSTDTGDVGTTA
ncbi:MAG TPA: hypothetical protein VGS21_03990, partial [Acidimicrobiales bacterium]|nr:hypothetical protein [Acidimicrobiales bacterium]